MVVGRCVGLGVLEAPATVKTDGEMRIMGHVVAATALLLALSAGAAQSLSEYECRWAEKGGRVVSETGEVLHSAFVRDVGAYANSDRSTDDEIALDSEGRLVLNRPARGSITVDITCPGYIPRRVQLSLSDKNLCDDIVLYHAEGAHPMREFRRTVVFPRDQDGDICHFDFLDGDFLPPYGYGRVTDAVIRVSERKVHIVMLGQSSGFAPPCVFGAHAAEPLRVADDSSCMNPRIEVQDQWTAARRTFAHPFRARGHFGYMFNYYNDRGPNYRESHAVDIRRGEEPRCVVSLWGRINEKAGERSLLAMHADEPPPKNKEDHEVPWFAGKYAFGVSEDGRSAYYLGIVDDSKKVPAEFPRAVYTSSPARDLKDVETLYACMGSIPAGAFAGMPNLRTVVAESGFASRPGEGAFAGCPKLNAVILDRWPYECSAASVFAGSAKGLALVSLRAVLHGDDRKWKWKLGFDGFRWEVSVPQPRSRPFLQSGLAVRGVQEIPVVRFSGESLEMEFPGGRIFELRSDGSEIRRWK